MADVYGVWEEPRWTPTRMLDDGDRVVLEVEEWVRGKGSGAEVELTWGTLYHLSARGGIARQDAFYKDGWKAALEAAGLTP